MSCYFATYGENITCVERSCCCDMVETTSNIRLYSNGTVSYGEDECSRYSLALEIDLTGIQDWCRKYHRNVTELCKMLSQEIH